MRSHRSIELNADIGEGGTQDEAVVKHLSSANIACGGHFGDVSTMRESLRLCSVYGVAAGAHPSFMDRANFGMQDFDLSTNEIRGLVREQLESLKEVAHTVGVELLHVKLHGALYETASYQVHAARAVAEAVRDAEFRRIHVQAGYACALRYEAQALGLDTVPEGSADQPYSPNGTLLAGELPHAAALEQGLAIAEGHVRAIGGTQLPIPARALSFRNAGPLAAALARDLGATLRQAGVRIESGLA